MKFFGLCKGIKEMNIPDTFEVNMYEGRFSLLYDSIVSNDLGDIDYYLKLADLYGKNILELGCGSGRVILPLLNHGLNVTGVDLSEDMLRICELKCSSMNNKPSLILHDMCSYIKSNTYDVVILAETSLCLVENQESRIALFCNVFKSLRVGGVFIYNYYDNSLEKESSLVPYYFFNPIKKSFCVMTEKFNKNKKTYNVNIYLEDIDDEGKAIRYITSTEKKFLSRNIIADITKKTSFEKIQESTFNIGSKTMVFEVLLKCNES